MDRSRRSKTGAFVLVAAVALALLECREASQDEARQAPPRQVVPARAPKAGRTPAVRGIERPAKTAPGDARPIYRVGGEVSRPVLLHRARIDFSRLGHIRFTGVPILEAIITETGMVENVRMLRPTDPKLDALLLDTVRQWRFRPAMKDGRPVRVYYTLTVQIHWQ